MRLGWKRGSVALILFGALLVSTGCSRQPNLTGDISVSILEPVWRRSETRVELPELKPLVTGYPLIQTKGMVKDEKGKYLYISDTGRDTKYNEAAKIWRVDSETGDLELFFTGEPLVTSKWLFYVPPRSGRPAELVISDYGVEPVSRQAGTGEGAKVFAIPINSDGSAGKPRILHEGPPFRSPEGITVIGDTVVVADVGAGGVITRPEVPGREFLGGALFQLPLAGGEPKRIAPDHKWVTVIGVCGYPEYDQDYIMVIDLDSGRHDKSRLAALPQSGSAEFFKLPIKSLYPFETGDLERVVLTEDGPLTLRAVNLPEDHSIVVKAGEGTWFEDDTKERVITTKDLAADGTYRFTGRTDMSNPVLSYSAEVTDRKGKPVFTASFKVDKDPDQEMMLADNKHAPTTTSTTAGGNSGFYASTDGTTRSISLFKRKGGTPIRLWKGDPLMQPMAMQFSNDKSQLYITDQSGGKDGTSVVWTLTVPTVDEMGKLLSQR